MDSATLEPGQVIAKRYRVVRRLGMGGMGAVYEAQHLELGRLVAVKVLLPQFSFSGDMTARFMREARSAAQIGHPGIVQVFDLGVDAGLPFLVMEKLEGEELSDRIAREHPLPVSWVTSMAVELCDALQAAHDHGIVHRDLKPPNVFLARQGRRSDVVKVLDFGIAKLIHGADDIQTRTGQVFGTPMYMAPEQLRDSKDVDGRVDVYAIGCLIFQALTGKPPFEATTYPDLVFRICSAPRPDVSELRGDVSRALSQMIARAMALEPSDRPKSPAELARALGAPESVVPIPDPGDRVFVSAPTELASSAAALTPHSRTAPPVPGVARSRVPMLLVGGALLATGAFALQRRATLDGGAHGDSSALPSGSSAPADLPSVLRAPSVPAAASPSAEGSAAGTATAAAPSASAPNSASKNGSRPALRSAGVTAHTAQRLAAPAPAGPTPPAIVPP